MYTLKLVNKKKTNLVKTLYASMVSEIEIKISILCSHHTKERHCRWDERNEKAGKTCQSGKIENEWKTYHCNRAAC